MMDIKDKTREGYEAISKYIREKRPRYNIFGHYQENAEFATGRTRCCCVYGCSVMDCKTGTIENIF